MGNSEKKHTAKRIYRSALSKTKQEGFDTAEVARLLAQAAKLGSEDATYALATWYLHGKHFHADLDKGTRLLTKAARLGSAPACYDLAVSFEKGLGVAQDHEMAFQLYLEAALRGDTEAKKQVVRCIWHGIGTRKNRKLAEVWGGFFKVWPD